MWDVARAVFSVPQSDRTMLGHPKYGQLFNTCKLYQIYLYAVTQLASKTEVLHLGRYL